MKYFLKIVTVLVLAVAVVFGVYYYTNGRELPFQKSNVNLTTVSKAPVTEKNADRKLLAAMKDEDFTLYKSGRTVLLTHGDKEFEFENWSSMIDAETPTLYYFDLDGDKKKELIVRAVSGELQNGDGYLYDLYILKQNEDSEQEAYDVIHASRNTWSNILDENIREEISQLKDCKKIVQFAMDTNSKSISYDKNTGIAKSASVGFARGMQDKNGTYLTVESWAKGNGLYTISKSNKICIAIDVNISYQDAAEVQSAGTIRFELSLKGKSLRVTPKTMYFEAAEKYRVSDPTKTAAEGWSYTENNANRTTPSDRRIQWVKYRPDLAADMLTRTTDFSVQETDINGVSQVVVTDSYAALTAKQGCSFDETVVEKGEFSVVINKGQKDEYEISYTASVDKSGDSQILKISFDKAYQQGEIKTLDISYGSR